MVTMKTYSEFVVDVHDTLNSMGSLEEPLDILSRSVILEVARANAKGYPIRMTDIVRSVKYASHVTVHERIKTLVEANLIERRQHPHDSRAKLLYLAPIAQEKMKKLAQEIRQLCEKHYTFATAILSLATPSWI